MRSSPRLYIDAPLATGGEAPLTAPQAHYLRNVMRRREGETVSIFNGKDGEFEGVIVALSKNGASLAVGARLRPQADEPDLWLLFAPVKRDAVDAMVRQATELGASRILPVRTERTNTGRVNEDRLRAIAIEAAEQCERLTIPDIGEWRALDAALDALGGDRKIFYCDEAGDDPAAPWGGRDGRAAPALEALRSAGGDRWAVLIGPEGGFSDAERAGLRARPNVVSASLGPRILRADTAAAAALAIWQAALGDFRAPS